MTEPRRSVARAGMVALLSAAACVTWLFHADAWDLGRRSPVLSYDAAQYAVAARELAEHGRLATPFALPLELSRQAQPPWPLALVQPGLVLAEAGLLRVVPGRASLGGRVLWRLERPDQIEGLLLVVPFVCFAGLAILIGLAVSRLLARHAPLIPEAPRAAAGMVAGLAFLLDPEAQHFAVGGFTEAPFTIGLMAVLFGIAMGRAASRPWLIGLLLGLTGLFRGVTPWLAPWLALAAAWSAEPGRRARVFATVLGAWALVLAPWWLYKVWAFGDPSWDLSRFSLWDGIEGRTWFSIFHAPDPPAFAGPGEALRLLAAKAARNLPRLALRLGGGLGALWIGALAMALALLRPPRALAAAGWAVLAVTLASLLATSLSVPLLRYLFPARIALAVAGLLALWALVARAVGPDPRVLRARLAFDAVGVLALAWGVWTTFQGLDEARAAAAERGTPVLASMLQIAELVEREVPAGEPVMSNLGPSLAWHARRPVVHLALGPEGLDAVRRRLDVRHVLLVFRDSGRAWPGWRELLDRPAEAPHRPEWNVRQVRQWITADGFALTWLELGPLAPGLAADVGR